jgi:hypothetical protein
MGITRKNGKKKRLGISKNEMPAPICGVRSPLDNVLSMYQKNSSNALIQQVCLVLL